MARDTRTLPEGWEKPIPEEIWPEAMISAVRHDASALASGRVIATIKLWQAEALDDSDTRAQVDARRMLRKLAESLSPEAVLDATQFDLDALATHPPEEPPTPSVNASLSDDYTVDAYELPPRPRRASRLETPKNAAVIREEDDETIDRPRVKRRPLSGVSADDAIVHEAESDSGRYRKVETGTSKVAEDEFSEENERPTTAVPHPTPSSGPKNRVPSFLLDSKPTPPPPPRSPPEEVMILPFDDELDPTRHIELPDEIFLKKADSYIHDLGLPKGSTSIGSLGPPDATEMAKHPRMVLDPNAEEEATHAIGPQDLPPRIDDLALDFGSDALDPLTPIDVPGRGHSLAPKPGVISRRRSTKSRRLNSSPRPRAAMHHVRALYYVLMPFAGELIPLSYERRSRRFWGRWREVAGDRGVRREFIEDLLRAANDTRTMVCELIAEVQSVDVRSVYALVEKLEHSGDLIDDGLPGVTDRGLSPMVGMPVDVVARDDEEQ